MKTAGLMLFYFSLFSTRLTIAAENGWVDISALRPTQKSLGLLEVAEKEARLEAMDPDAQRKYLKKRAAPAVVGPGGQLYLVDRHHLARAAWEAGLKRVFVEIRADWSRLSSDRFWKKMGQVGWVYLYDEHGEGPLDPASLPGNLFTMDDDPYRSLAWKVRKRGGYEKVRIPYSEFVWADFFRARIGAWKGRREFEAAIEQAMALAGSPAARGLPGFQGEVSCGAALARLAMARR